MEVDVNGSLSYPEPHMTAKDSGNVISVNFTHFPPQYVDSIMSFNLLIVFKVFH